MKMTLLGAPGLTRSISWNERALRLAAPGAADGGSDQRNRRRMTCSRASGGLGNVERMTWVKSSCFRNHKIHETEQSTNAYSSFLGYLEVVWVLLEVVTDMQQPKLEVVDHLLELTKMQEKDTGTLHTGCVCVGMAIWKLRSSCSQLEPQQQQQQQQAQRLCWLQLRMAIWKLRAYCFKLEQAKM